MDNNMPPSIKIQLRGLGTQFTGHIMSHADEMKELVEQAFDRAINSPDLMIQAQKQAADAISGIIRQSFNRYFSQDEMKRTIDDTIKKAVAGQLDDLAAEKVKEILDQLDLTD